MKTENDVLELIEKNQGFELTLGFINDEDHFIGGIGDYLWYCKVQGKKSELWTAHRNGDEWGESHVLSNGNAFDSEPVESGTTLKMITERFFFGQDYIEKDGRKPVAVENYGMTVDHYTYKFGELAYDINTEYGITVAYSNINDVSVGFRPRNIAIGPKIDPPKGVK